MRATSSRLACTSSIDMPTSRAISPGCGVMITSRPSRPASRSGSSGKRVQAIGVDDQRQRGTIDECVNEGPRAGPLAEAGADGQHVARRLEQVVHRIGIESVRRFSSIASVMYSGPIEATIGTHAGRRRHGDQPRARPQRADRGQMRGAGLAERAGDDEDAAVVALVRVCIARRRAVCRIAARVNSSTRGPSTVSMTSVGMPISAMTMSPARVSAGGSTSASFGAPSVIVVSASIESPIGSCESADRPGWQIDGDDRNARSVHVGDDGFEQSGERCVEPGAEDGIDDQRAVGDLGEVQFPRLAVGHLDGRQAQPAEDLEVDACIAAHVRDLADHEHRYVDAALQQRARDHEPVAAVVAASAQHRDRRAPADRRGSLPSQPRPVGRRSPSAPATGCRSPRSSGDPPRASAPR